MTADEPRDAAAAESEATRAFMLEQFSDFINLERGVSPRTDEAYGRDIVRFAQFCRT